MPLQKGGDKNNRYFVSFYAAASDAASAVAIAQEHNLTPYKRSENVYFIYFPNQQQRDAYANAVKHLNL